MWLTRLALRNPVLILMMSLMAIVLGLVSLQRLSVDLFPDINLPVIRVATFYPGAGPADIEKSITEPLERAVGAAPGLVRIESSTKQGLSTVSAFFDFSVNMDAAQFEVQQRVAQILNTLPPGVQQPFILKFDITNIPVLQVVVGSKDLDERELYDLAFNVIEPQLERVPGVASATVGGGKVREIGVLADPNALRARGVGLLDVVGAVRASNLLLPSGSLRTGVIDYNVFANSQFQAAEAIEDVVVRPAVPGVPSSRPVYVRDLARVVDGTAEQSEIVRINGARGVYLRVLKQPGSNTIAVVDQVRAAIKALRGLPPSVTVAVSFDQSNYIRNAVTALGHEALQGGLLAILVILLFLVSLRATAIVAVAIPLSVVATFILLYFTGQTLNVFTLGGLALAVGRLVDDSIVELENIHRHLQQGGNRRQAVLAAAQEVAMPILVSTITTIVVFFPVTFLTGVAQNLFVPLALTISFSLMVSFLVSRTVTPLLCLFILRSGHAPPAGFPGLMTRALARMDDAYAAVLHAVLRHRAVTIVSILALFGASVPLWKLIGTEFFPASDESQFSMSYRAPMGTRVDRTVLLGARLEERVRTALQPPGDGPHPVNNMMNTVGIPTGRTALFSGNTGPHSGSLNMNLVPPSARPFSDVEALSRVRASLKEDFPGIQVFFWSGGIVKRILNFGSGAPIDVEILGYDLEEGAAYARQLLARMRELRDEANNPLLTDVQVSREDNYPELRINVDREKAGLLGLTEQQIAQTVLSSLVGSTQFAPMQLSDPRTGNNYFISVRLDEAHRDSLADLSAIQLRAANGAMVTLDTVAKVERSSGPVVINRKYLQRIIDITADVAPGKDLGGATAAVQALVDELPPPDGFTVGLGGQSAAQREAFSGLGFAALLAILLVYMVLASQFRSLVDPLVIMFSVPLGVSGVALSLYLTGTTLSVNSFMGIIMMVGIVVSNGVLLVDFANVLRRDHGLDLVEATIRAGRTRLRPILMTTIATIVGLVPMAVGIGEGSETNMPLARAVIGGLGVSTFFTLFLVPALYTVLDRVARRAPDADDNVPAAAHAAPGASV
ncbi:MAG: efflux RND transporter permease subunit [Deltaproteobacteria bacterium]|nr:efflux RND transporter permease subunit [Deltaproteobacteria bacterium]